MVGLAWHEVDRRYGVVSPVVCSNGGAPQGVFFVPQGHRTAFERQAHHQLKPTRYLLPYLVRRHMFLLHPLWTAPPACKVIGHLTCTTPAIYTAVAIEPQQEHSISRNPNFYLATG